MKVRLEVRGWTVAAADGGVYHSGRSSFRTPQGKIKTGLQVAALTTAGGIAWTFVWMNLIVYLPRRLRRRR
ncbi:MAG: hypothetical protein HY812_14370 [Planctomycetes bacterium]|nr:hypothetical protein [Planctomycetota bacterium]